MREQWAVKRLGDVATKIGSGSTPRGGEAVYRRQGVPFIRSMNVHFSGFKNEGLVFLDDEQAKRLENVTVAPGDVLLNITGASIGRVTTAPPDLLGARVNQHVCIIRPRPVLDPKFLAYFLASPAEQARVAAIQVGATRQALTKAMVENWTIPVPPLELQQETVAAIEEQFSRLDAGVEALLRAKANLKRYRAAVLKAACEGRLVPTEAEVARLEGRTYECGKSLLMRLAPSINATGSSNYGNSSTLPEGWSSAPIGAFARVATGATPLRGKARYYEGGVIPWVTSGALNRQFVDSATEFITQAALTETNAKIFPPGTLLIALYGEGKTRGKVSELRIHAATNQACAAVILNGEVEVIRPYLRIFLENNYENVRRLSSGGVQPNLSLAIVRNTPIPLPPLAEQTRIVSEVEQLVSVTSQAGASIEAGLQRAARLRQALLLRAFSEGLAA